VKTDPKFSPENEFHPHLEMPMPPARPGSPGEGFKIGEWDY